ncbi:MFS transporter [Streptomyces sp. NPDC047525]|uniref:MFS transporter n=1 Tax=Streptomyces sp. NPDC047525 TaxID=3155264 RepID=UPI00340FD1E3
MSEETRGPSDTGTSTESGGAAPAARRPDRPPAPLRKNADFIRLWVGAGISQFGTRVGMTAFPLLTLYLTGSAMHAGLVGFAASLPNFVVQLPAGALVDRWDRRRLMLWCDILGALSIASVAVAVALGHVWLPHLMAAAFLEGTRGIVVDLGERASVRQVVPAGHLPAALAQNEARGQAMGLLGQPSAGGLLAVAAWLPFATTALASSVAAVCVALMRGNRGVRAGSRARPLHTDIREGITWLWRHRVARFLVALFAGCNFAFQILMLTVMVIIQQSGRSPVFVALVTGCGGLGGLAGALAAPRLRRRFGLRPVFLTGCAAWTLITPLVAWVRHPAGLAVILTATTLIVGALSVTAWVFQVQNTPDELQGRVNGTARFLASGANSLGALSGGFLLASVGAGPTGLVVCGVMLLVTAVVLSGRRTLAEPADSL